MLRPLASLTFVFVTHCADLNASSAQRTQLAAAEGTWSFDQYAVRVLLSFDDEQSTTTSKFMRMTDLQTGSRVTTGFLEDQDRHPPFYLFSSGSGKPYWQYPRYNYHEGHDLHDLARCNAGDWQDESVPSTYETGPQFLKEHPKESWTLCDVAYDGGNGGAEQWYLYFADVKMEEKAKGLVRR